ncbi:hypothetical protein Slala05_56590 [Streptomyces lavendulae subsp. lavendulae]|nr:hypothetical protein Slala05_56590 [Streptomyces lavendulae subsp. lavendulae]
MARRPLRGGAGRRAARRSGPDGRGKGRAEVSAERRNTGCGDGKRRKTADGARQRAWELRAATTDGARDTDQVHVPALDEGDGSVTEGLHEPEACTNAQVPVNQGIPDAETPLSDHPPHG